jgi:hypothetical protein
VTARTRDEKPLGHRAYTKIPHLPGSRTGQNDTHAPRELARWCTHQCRAGDTVVVQEKLDGSCVAVALLGREVVPLGREGFRLHAAPTGAAPQNPGRRMFARWVAKHEARFRAVLTEGEWLVGEWLALAHSTRYQLAHEPFVVFDLCSQAGGRDASSISALAAELADARLKKGDFVRPHVLHRGGAISVEAVDQRLGAHGHHGAVDRVEGAMWRVERKEEVVFRAKFVRPGKTDGALLPENSGQPAIWNWTDGEP